MNQKGNIKLAIIGASQFQNPLILKAKSRGIETHVFAWENGDIGEKEADFFYPISIIDKETILDQCKEIGVNGVASIGSDLANITVAYVAEELGLISNSIECVLKSTDKHEMRKCFEMHGDPTPKSVVFSSVKDIKEQLSYPIIVKPADRSGSRGIRKLDSSVGLVDAVQLAKNESFSGVVLVEEFVEGREFSVETISWKGSHTILAITEKFTTGAPNYIEMGHLEPARITLEEKQRICTVAIDALRHLGVEYGASHTELKIDSTGQIKIIEIGSRMGGDFIGSSLVELSTGYDFVDAVIDVALGNKPMDASGNQSVDRAAAVRFIFSINDIKALEDLENKHPDWINYKLIKNDLNNEVSDSSTRNGFVVFSADSSAELESYLPVGF